MLRMVLRIGHRRYTNEERDLFLLLETHIKDIRDKNKSQWNRIALTSKAVKAYSGTDLELDAILEFGARLDVNSFNLVTPLHDRIGLYLDPGAAFINHSCDYNSVVGFDGDELFVKAIRTIQKDEQIFISYIDSTNPCDIRQAELRERYFFDCRCPKCEPGEDPADLLPDPSTIETAERNPIDITVTENSDPSKTVSQVESAMQTLRQTYSWPLTRQPLITLRDELITALLSTGKFNSAFIQAAIRHTRVDPIVYPLDAHPLRNIHAWTLAKQAIHLSQEMDPDPVGTISLYKYDMNFSLIIWSILNDLVNRESQSCTVPSFKKIVRSAYDEVNQEFLVNGLDPNHMREEIKKEWEKMDRLVSLALDKN
ncbi:hypothetical protein EYZ11_002082 [Aspergillus tanneri]|nr:hypothetical protein EYZ11_002082 [Aspergillus tanneri]